MRRPFAEEPPRDVPQALNPRVVARHEMLDHVSRIPFSRHRVAGQDSVALAASRAPGQRQENFLRSGMHLPVLVPPEADHDPLDPGHHQVKQCASVARDALRLDARRAEELEPTSSQVGDVLIQVDWNRDRGGFPCLGRRKKPTGAGGLRPPYVSPRGAAHHET